MEMTCAEFEVSFDQYVDETLDAAMMNAASCHLSKCRPCDREVTRWQQTRILLSTAVADLSTAVDVSSVRSDVFAALGYADDGALEPRRSAMREAAYDRSEAKRSAGRTSRRAASGGRRGVLAGVVRFASAATVSAVAAAAAVMVLTPAPQQSATQQFASAKPAVTSAAGGTFRQASLGNWSKNQFEDIAPVSYSPPPLARPEVSHVDGLEAAPGQQVATWVQPRTGARVIWVENRGHGAPVRMAGSGR